MLVWVVGVVGALGENQVASHGIRAVEAGSFTQKCPDTMPEHVDKPICTLGHVYYDLTLPRCPHRPHHPYQHSSSLSHYSGHCNSVTKASRSFLELIFIVDSDSAAPRGSQASRNHVMSS